MRFIPFFTSNKINYYYLLDLLGALFDLLLEELFEAPVFLAVLLRASVVELFVDCDFIINSCY